MFSDEEITHHVAQKRQRITRACDTCRRKKIRCNGVQMPGIRCSPCTASGSDCTYAKAARFTETRSSNNVRPVSIRLLTLGELEDLISYFEDLAFKREQTQRTPRQLLPKNLGLTAEHNLPEAPIPSSIPHA
ncbi:hypothetical protein MPER_07533, partial [Moniliophthora perniciosa FA553]